MGRDCGASEDDRCPPIVDSPGNRQPIAKENEGYLPFLKHASLVSLFYVLGRSANVLLPVFVIYHYGASDTTDFFFLGLSISFYFYGTLFNSVVETNIPLLIRQNILISTRHSIYLSILAVVVITLFLANYRSLVSVSEFWRYLVSFCGISVCGLLSVRNTVVLFSNKKFFLPNILWSLRFFPILFVIWQGDNDAIALVEMTLLLLIMDFVRLLVIKADPSSQLSMQPIDSSSGKMGTAVLLMFLAVVVTGLNPVVDRWIASFSGPGAVSVLDISERLFWTLHASIAAGFISVSLVDMSYKSRQSGAGRYWKKMTLLAFLIGIGGFALLSILSFLFIGYLGSATLPKLDAENHWRIIHCVLFYGMGIPLLMVGGVCGRFALIHERYYSILILAIVSFTLNVFLSLLLYRFLAVPGIALATSLTYLIVVSLGILVCRDILKSLASSPAAP